MESYNLIQVDDTTDSIKEEEYKSVLRNQSTDNDWKMNESSYLAQLVTSRFSRY